MKITMFHRTPLSGFGLIGRQFRPNLRCELEVFLLPSVVERDNPFSCFFRNFLRFPVNPGRPPAGSIFQMPPRVYRSACQEPTHACNRTLPFCFDVSNRCGRVVGSGRFFAGLKDSDSPFL